VADLHLTAIPPASRVDDYQESIFKKLAQCTELVKSLHIDAVVILGDIFHLKHAAKTPYWLTLKFVDWLKEINSLGCRIGVVVGNHDVPYGNVELVSRQPIGVVLALPFVERELMFEDSGLRIVCKDFNPVFTGDYLKVERGSEKFLMVCVHQCLLSKGQFYDEPTVNFDEVSIDADVLAFGHIHSPTVIEKVGKTLFVCPGAISRGTANKDNLEREVGVILLKFEDGVKFKQIDLKSAPSSEVFSIELREDEKVRDNEIAEFVEELKTVTVGIVASDPASVLEGMDISEKVKSVARLYLDGDGMDMENL
jgi:DNA repair exonuclease SbcCD nuclease subunit